MAFLDRYHNDFSFNTYNSLGSFLYDISLHLELIIFFKSSQSGRFKAENERSYTYPHEIDNSTGFLLTSPTTLDFSCILLQAKKLKNIFIVPMDLIILKRKHLKTLIW